VEFSVVVVFDTVVVDVVGTVVDVDVVAVLLVEVDVEVVVIEPVTVVAWLPKAKVGLWQLGFATILLKVNFMSTH
jgi:hypothetical protein